MKSYVHAFCGVSDALLEIGAARGHYVSVLGKAGFDAYGCDPGDPRVHEELLPFVFPETDFADIDGSCAIESPRFCSCTCLSTSSCRSN